MDTLVSSEWPLLNQDFDEGSILADFDCEVCLYGIPFPFIIRTSF